MIKSFGILYAGNIDFADQGFNGTPANERNYDNEILIKPLSTAMEIAQLADNKVFDVLWLAEHHFQREGYECIPNILMLGLHLANHTKTLKFGCAFNILPAWHPLRLAEDYSMADILTNGRILFGVGRGYHTREVETLGSPLLDAQANRDLFEEQVEILFHAFNDRTFSHKGSNYVLPPEVPYRGYNLNEISLVPRPINLPVETWQPIVSGNPRGLRFMHKHGIKGLISGVPATTVERNFLAFQQTGLEFGRNLQLGEDLCLGLRFCIAENQKEAVEKATPGYEESLKFNGPLGFFMPTLTKEQETALRDKANTEPPPSIMDGIKDGTWVCGSSESVIEHLKKIESKYPGLEHLMFNIGVGTNKELFMEQLQIFAENVIPAFRD